MRTTINIDDDILTAAKSLAKAENRPLGEVISALARRGLRPSAYPEVDDSFPCFRIAEDAPPITLELVRRALEDSD